MTEAAPALGRYQAKRLLGEGGFGRVWLARDPLLDRDVAVKVPRGPWVRANDILAEARALARLAHPCIVQVLDAGLEGETAFVVMELVDGLSLEGVLLRSRTPAAPARALELLRGPAAALDHAHSRGILHGDLKPANLLAPLDGPVLGGLTALTAPLKVADLGLLALATRGGAAAAAFGDPRFAAPETWSGRLVAASDVYSLAAVFFQLVSGSTALVGSARELLEAAPSRPRRHLREALPSASRPLDDALARALSLDPAERPESAEALMASLGEAIESSSTRGRMLRDVRERIAAREPAAVRTTCASCRKPLHPKTTACPHCGEVVG